jgi:hypothetical protein
MSGQVQSAYRRVIVGLCHSEADAKTMRTAAEFARLLGLDLHCLLIEDEALLALAELPFAREIRLPAHKWSPLTTDAVEADIRQITIQMRRQMDEIIRDFGVPTDFEVLRGDPAACITATCQASDIVVVSGHGPSTVPATHSLTRLRAGAHEAATSILLLPTRFQNRHGPVVALLNGTEDSALDMACRLAASAKEDLVILLPEQSGTREAAEAGARRRAYALGLSCARISARIVRGVQMEDFLLALADVRERLIVTARDASIAAIAPHVAAARGAPLLLVAAQGSAGQQTPQ